MSVLSIEQIHELATKIKRRTGESDPFTIYKDLRIMVQFLPMGMDATACKGFFLKKNRVKTIVINDDLSDDIQRIILTHEIGHALLHGNHERACAFHDFALFDNLSTYEYEANMFAAEFLITDEDALEHLNSESFFFTVAKTLRVPPELLDFKFRSMKKRGFVLNPPMYANGNFLKDITNQDRFE